ncbi:MAG TPA: hypothetical protein VFW31_03530 [Candidatus Angelobacter sp.]|nr:hypothetical protein [Candidatus Angelobacter sp.]
MVIDLIEDMQSQELVQQNPLVPRRGFFGSGAEEGIRPAEFLETFQHQQISDIY